MKTVVFVLLHALRSCFRTRLALQAENLALRHQIAVLQRGRKRLPLNAADRFLWVCLSRLWVGWRSALAIFKPEPVIRWHRKGFRLYWRWKSPGLRIGRRQVPQDVQDLIRKMSLANPLWGAPHIHGELLKLGVELSQATVAKYMERRRKPPSQTWRTFLDSHLKCDGAMNQLVMGEKLAMQQSFEELVARYGEDNARYLLHELENMTRHYSQVTLLEMGVEPDASFERRAREKAEARGWKFEKVQRRHGADSAPGRWGPERE